MRRPIPVAAIGLAKREEEVFVPGRASSVQNTSLRVSGLSSFGEDANGELYATSLNGTLYIADTFQGRVRKVRRRWLERPQ